MKISEKLNYPYLFDSHAHLNASEYDPELAEVIGRAEKRGVRQIFDVGVDIESSRKAIENAKRFPDVVMATAGIDPEVFQPGSAIFEDLEKNDDWFELQYNLLKNLILNNREFIVGIGETGMDYYWIKEHDEGVVQSSKKLQKRLFELHLELAQELKLFTTIHSRGAEEACLEVIENYDVTGIFHSYTGSYQTAVSILDQGYGLGVNGIVTFKKANELRNIYKRILGNVSTDWQPQDFYKKGIFFETDSPFLSPEGKRGQRNEPSNTRDIYEQFSKFLTTSL